MDRGDRLQRNDQRWKIFFNKTEVTEVAQGQDWRVAEIKFYPICEFILDLLNIRVSLFYKSLIMSEPFSFLDEEEEDDRDRGVAWLPLTLAGLALAGFLMIPILGLFGTSGKKGGDDWSKFAQTDAIPVGIQGEVPEGDWGEIDAESLVDAEQEGKLPLDELKSVDETLASLGGDLVPAQPNDSGVTLASTRASEQIPVAKSKPVPAVKKSAALKPVEKVANTSASAERITAPASPGAAEGPQSVRPAPSTYEVQPGDTLYGIARANRTTPYEIAQASGIKTEDPIMVGQTIRLPGVVDTGGATAEIQRAGVPGIGGPGAGIGGGYPGAGNYPGGPGAGGYPGGPNGVSPNPRVVRPQDPNHPSIVNPTYPNYPGGGDDPIYRDPQLFPNDPNGGGEDPVASMPRPDLPGAGGPDDPTAGPSPDNPLDKYNHAIAYRVQMLDNLNKIANSHATTEAELIELNGRSKVKRGEMIIVPVDNCLIK